MIQTVQPIFPSRPRYAVVTVTFLIRCELSTSRDSHLFICNWCRIFRRWHGHGDRPTRKPNEAFQARAFRFGYRVYARRALRPDRARVQDRDATLARIDRLDRIGVGDGGRQASRTGIAGAVRKLSFQDGEGDGPRCPLAEDLADGLRQRAGWWAHRGREGARSGGTGDFSAMLPGRIKAVRGTGG